jgi:cysteine desulfuration protein SufE
MSPEAEARLSELVDDFDTVAELGAPDARFLHLFDLAKRLAPMPDAFRTDANRVPGCTAITHLVVEDAGPEAVRFAGDSEAKTTRGFIAILDAVLNGGPASDVMAFDAEDAFRRLGFAGATSASRSNAFTQLVRRLKEAVA